MRRFQDLVQEKLHVMREDKFIADEIHAWALLSYLLDKLKNYLMNEEDRHKDFEQDNTEILLWLSYIGGLAQHSAEQLKLIPIAEGTVSSSSDDGKYLFSLLDSILSHILSNKRPSKQPLQKSNKNRRWFDVQFSEEYIGDLARIVGNYKKKEKDE